MTRGRLSSALCLALVMVMPVGSAAQGENPVVVIETSMGDITVELFPDRAPKSVENFLAYVSQGFYDGTIFHGVISNFMIQGGGFTADMQKKDDTRAPIENEADNGLKNGRGTLAMARTPEIHSATAQFFINVKDNAFLDYKGPSAADFGYAVFGQVTEGLDVVDKIKSVKTGGAGPYQDVPVEAVVIKTIRVQTGN
ncbi:MAG TPA: peptidylprolyl isomerase [Vicinamibacteria bacterium]|nr:peptidylprolyl isomerase [Vicinamibacteria bacterium]